MGAVAFVGCDAHETSESPAAPPQVVVGNGIVRGVLKFTGTPPVMKTIENRPCHDGAGPITEESVIVNANHTLRNALVWLEGAPHTDGSKTQPKVLDQVSCRYVPHVLGVQAGQKLRVRSSDPTLHNVHCLASINRAVNFGMSGAGQEKTIAFDSPEIIPVKCDVHPWMVAYIGVFANPWFAVTGGSGSFELKGIPVGSYKLVSWHERYGRLERDVTVGDEIPVEADFEYKQ